MRDINSIDTNHDPPSQPLPAQPSETVSEQPPPNAAQPPKTLGSHKIKVPSQVDELLELAAGIELIHTPDDLAYATIEINGHRENWLLRSSEFAKWFKREFYRRHQCVPKVQAMRETLDMLEARARYEGPEEPVYIRIAGKNGAVYLDLGDKEWRAIAITP